MGLILLLPVVGLVRITSSLVLFLALWLIVAAGHYLASTNASDISAAVTFTNVSLFLFVMAFVIAAFVAYSPDSHTSLILNAWTFAALLATLLALMGYLGAFPGAESLFTKFGRASGTFKDPNVFGAFIIAPIIYMLHLSIYRPASKILLPLLAAGILTIGVLLSFSRGAWLNLMCAILIFGYLAFVTAASVGQRFRIALLLGAGLLVGVTFIGVAVQFDQVSDLLSQRASLLQSYDAGHEGRFGGQAKAISIIAQNPMGIGPKEFASQYHHEEAHNVFLSMVLKAGWLGGGVYWILVGLTIILGLRHALNGSNGRPVFLVVFAAFISNALEGLVIDSDHWRHFYILMALCWGLMSVPSLGAADAFARRSLPERNDKERRSCMAQYVMNDN